MKNENNIILITNRLHRRNLQKVKAMNTFKSREYQDIRDKAEKKLIENYKYSMLEIDDIAENVLQNATEYSEGQYTPIVAIARQFGFDVYKGNVEKDLCGYIKIDKDLQKTFGTDRIIMVSANEEIGHQRFVIAHELGHFLFGYDHNKNEGKYYNTYRKNNHTDVQECLANRFAASLLMPKQTFIERYKIAQNIDNSEMFIEIYLSKFFKTSVESIRKRIQEVL